jgi:hypothetical protein
LWADLRPLKCSSGRRARVAGGSPVGRYMALGGRRMCGRSTVGGKATSTLRGWHGVTRCAGNPSASEAVIRSDGWGVPPYPGFEGE